MGFSVTPFFAVSGSRLCSVAHSRVALDILSMNSYDVAILGSGPGGYVAAIRAAQAGMSVAIIEEREFGGTCLNRGCIPSKALIESTKVYHLLEKAASFGVKASKPEIDFPAMMERKNKIVAMLRGGVEALMKKNKIEVLRGRGRVKDKNSFIVSTNDGEAEVRARTLILATGSEPLEIPAFPFDGENILSSNHALGLERTPKNLLIVGGGYIGCEWASIFSALGCPVTIVEMMDSLMPMLDAELVRELAKRFKKAGVDIHLKTKVESISSGGAGVTAKLDSGEELEFEKVIVSVGRKLNSDALGLEEVGIDIEKGAIKVNEFMQTSVPNVYAIGDVTGRMLLAHVAYRQANIAVGHIAGGSEAMNYRVVPACVFTYPEIGTVGMTETEAKEAGESVKTGKFSYRASGKALCMGETDGFVKLVARESDGEILGAHIIGPHATDIVAEAALAMQLECTAEELVRTIHAHPTIAESLAEAADGLLGKAVHG